MDTPLGTQNRKTKGAESGWLQQALHLKYSNFSFNDTLPEGVDYQDASVSRVYNGTTTDVTKQGILSYNPTTRKVIFSFHSTYVSDEMLYQGETYVLKNMNRPPNWLIGIERLDILITILSNIDININSGNLSVLLSTCKADERNACQRGDYKIGRMLAFQRASGSLGRQRAGRVFAEKGVLSGHARISRE